MTALANGSRAAGAAGAAAAADWLRATLPPGAALRSDSRRVARGDAFFAYPGERSDGRRFIGQAIERGAAAVVWERDGFDWQPGWALPNRGVDGLKPLCGPIAAFFHGLPTDRLRVVAVTGTNGKTSCSHWIAQGLQAAGRDAAVVGTLGAGRPGRLDDTGLTTPDALDLQRLFAAMAGEGIADVAIEASSIGIGQGRLDGTRIAVAVFTNLTRDHLDAHGTMAAYAAAKARLFAWPGLAAAVVNLDDPWAGTMLGAVAPDTLRIGYRIDGAAGRPDPGGSPACHLAAGEVDRTLVAASVAATGHGTRFTLAGDYGDAAVEIPLIGRFNVANALAVAGAWLALGMRLADAVGALRTLAPVPGRLQVVPAAGDAPLVVVDYAHTPDALANALAALRPVAAARGGRLWCVFGAGGDRDPGKRPQMGAAAEAGADAVALTSDNPRGESPQAIIAAIRAGMTGEPALREADRARAIAWVVDAAAAADVVLLAGKGHEPYQEVAGARLPFSDLGEAAAALARRARGDGGAH